MIATGDFPILLQNSVADAAPRMLESEMILDITDLVEEYMPTYYGLLQENQALRSKAVYEIDGGGQDSRNLWPQRRL